MPPKHTGNGMITNRYLQGSYMNIFWAQLAKEKDCRQLLEILLLLLQNFQENPVFTIPKFGNVTMILIYQISDLISDLIYIHT